jgi:hypothetical protein
MKGIQFAGSYEERPTAILYAAEGAVVCAGQRMSMGVEVPSALE